MTKVHIDDLVVKVLCKKHNQELSDLDQALIDLVNVLRELKRLREVRGRLHVKWDHQPTRFVVDGPRIERCILKMVMNCSTLMRDKLEDWRPPDWLPEVIFGSRQLGPGCGLSALVRVGDEIGDEETLSFTFGRSQREGVPVAVILDLHAGWRLHCTWDSPAEQLGQIRFEGEIFLPGADDLFHPKRAQFEHDSRALGLSLDFDWSGAWSPSRNKAVVRLRSKFKAPPRKK